MKKIYKKMNWLGSRKQKDKGLNTHVVISECEGCGKMIFEDDPYFVYTLDDIYLCKNCAPEGV